jgi:hypothetical protein
MFDTTEVFVENIPAKCLSRSCPIQFNKRRFGRRTDALFLSVLNAKQYPKLQNRRPQSSALHAAAKKEVSRPNIQDGTKSYSLQQNKY